MATNKNITMKQFNGTDYDTLYPKTKVEQVEGAYTQQQILADSTKGLYGLGTDAVPDDAFVSLKTLVSNVTESVKSKAQIVTGTYTGTGNTKAKKTLTFPFAPKLLFISSNSNSYYSYLWVINFGGGSYGIAENSSNSKASLLSVTFSGSQVSWTPRDSVVGLDWSGYTYRYVAIG